MQKSKHQTKRNYRIRKGCIGFILTGGIAAIFFFIVTGAKGNDSISKPVPVTAPQTQKLQGGQETKIHDGDWNLLLVNAENPIPDSYDVSLTQLMNGQAVDSRCYPDLQEMMDACRAEGLKPVICSSYRTLEKQKRLYEGQVSKYRTKGYSLEEAQTEAGKAVAVPGTSEHQLGLAVDIVAVDNQNLDQSQEQTAVQKWLMKHCWKFGFILRYPNDKSNVTNIIYEPWHYRYVGKEAAKEMYDLGVCLEEYVK